MTLTSATDGKRFAAGARDDLGHLLEVVHLAHRRLASFEGEYRDWSRARPSLALLGTAGREGGWDVRWRGEGPFPPTHVSHRRIQLSGPDHARVEVRTLDSLSRAGVRTGTDWWFWDSDRGLVTHADDHSDAALPVFLRPAIIDPAPLLGTLWFEPAGTGSLADREVLRARAFPREPAQAGVEVTHEFDFDAEHGTVLRRVVLEDGEPVREVRALNVRYDSDIDPATFARDPRHVLGSACVNASPVS